MISYDIDPSLHNAKPQPPRLDDGFSPPHPQPGDDAPGRVANPPAGVPVPAPLGEISPF